jgi:hypothetical protein
LGIAVQRAIPDGGVPLTDGVEIKRKRAVGCVKVTFSVARKGERASCRVFLGNGVV